MNRLLYVGRKAKGLTMSQLAQVLGIEENVYIEIEHSFTDLNASQALKLAKLFDVDPEVFIYTEGRDTQLIKHSMDEISAYLKNGEAEKVHPEDYFRTVELGNTALSLMADLNYSVYKRYELEKDNQALRILISALKDK